MDFDNIDLEQLVNDVLAEAGEKLSQTVREGYQESGRGAVRLRFDFTPVEDADRVRMDAKLLGYQEQEKIQQAQLGEAVDQSIASYDPTTEGVAVFTLEEGQTGYFQFTLAKQSS